MSDVDAYQIEVEKNGRYDVVELMIGTVRGPRGKRNLYGEAHMRDLYTPRIYFKVQHVQSLEELFDRFMTQLIHRGFTPLRFRESTKTYWGDWSYIDLSRYDTEDLERAKERINFL